MHLSGGDVAWWRNWTCEAGRVVWARCWTGLRRGSGGQSRGGVLRPRAFSDRSGSAKISRSLFYRATSDQKSRLVGCCSSCVGCWRLSSARTPGSWLKRPAMRRRTGCRTFSAGHSGMPMRSAMTCRLTRSSTWATRMRCWTRPASSGRAPRRPGCSGSIRARPGYGHGRAGGEQPGQRVPRPRQPARPRPDRPRALPAQALGLVMLERARAAGVPFSWLSGDSVYGAEGGAPGSAGIGTSRRPCRHSPVSPPSARRLPGGLRKPRRRLAAAHDARAQAPAPAPRLDATAQTRCRPALVSVAPPTPAAPTSRPLAPTDTFTGTLA